MINFLEFDRRKDSVKDFLVVVGLVAREEGTLVVNVLDEGVSCISIGLDGSNDNGAVFIRKFAGRRYSNTTMRSRVFIDGLNIVNIKGNILDTVTMINKVLVHLF